MISMYFVLFFTSMFMKMISCVEVSLAFSCFMICLSMSICCGSDSAPIFLGVISSLKTSMILMTFLISIPLFIVIYFSKMTKQMEKLNTSMMILILIMMVYFSVDSFSAFYSMFELSVIPIFLVIMGWGYQVERLKASLMLVFYTLTASLPLLAVLIFWSFFSLPEMIFMSYSSSAISSGTYLVLSSLLAFLVKAPCYLVHFWLPQAHVEAPVFGSMILASVMLKLGVYGMLVILPYIMSSWITEIVMGISLWGMVSLSLMNLRLLDMKSIIALSSVVHMGLCIMSIFFLTEISQKVMIWVSISHAFSSPAMFLGAGLFYERSHSRMLLLNKASLLLLPALAGAWFFTIACNLAAPPTLNLMGELMGIILLISYSWGFSMLLSISIMGSSAFSLILYTTITQSESFLRFQTGGKMVNSRELLSLYSHLIPAFLSPLIMFTLFY